MDTTQQKWLVWIQPVGWPKKLRCIMQSEVDAAARCAIINEGLPTRVATAELSTKPLDEPVSHYPTPFINQIGEILQVQPQLTTEVRRLAELGLTDIGASGYLDDDELGKLKSLMAIHGIEVESDFVSLTNKVNVVTFTFRK